MASRSERPLVLPGRFNNLAVCFQLDVLSQQAFGSQLLNFLPDAPVPTDDQRDTGAVGLLGHSGHKTPADSPYPRTSFCIAQAGRLLPSPRRGTAVDVSAV